MVERFKPDLEKPSPHNPCYSAFMRKTEYGMWVHYNKYKQIQRALWLARAERAGCEQDYLRKMFEHYEDYYNVKTGKDFTKAYYDSVWNKWCWVEMKCKEKAEEYK